MGSPSRFLMGFPLPLPNACMDRGKRKRDRVPACRQRRKAAGGPQGRWAPLRGGLRPSLTATRRLATGKAGRDGGMVISIEHRDERWSEHRFACSFLVLFALFEGNQSTLIDDAYQRAQCSHVLPF